MDDLEIYHHGIKGMKWGIRRTPEQLGHTTGKARKAASAVGKAVGTAGKAVGSAGKKAATAVSEHRAAKKQKKAAEQEAERQKKLRKKPISEMTDDELKERIARLELEKRYRDLQPQTVQKGESWVARALKNAGESSLKNLAEQTFDTTGGEGINKIGEALFGWDPKNPNERVVNARKRQTQKK